MEERKAGQEALRDRHNPHPSEVVIMAEQDPHFQPGAVNRASGLTHLKEWRIPNQRDKFPNRQTLADHPFGCI